MEPVERRRARRRRQSGQATTEFVLLVSLVSIPLFLALKAMMQVVLHDFIMSLIARFTQG